MARRDLGRKPAELDLLLSPSRGLLGGDEDEVSLRNPEVQERFREHIANKLARWADAHPAGARDEARKRHMEELGIILLDFRKLREGITSIRRVDAFASEATASTSLDDALARLSLSSAAAPDPDTRAFFISLYLLHAYLLPAFASHLSPATPSAASPAHPPLSTFLPTLFSLLRASSLPLPSALYPRPAHPSTHITHLLSLYRALLALSSPSLARLLSPSALPPLPPHLRALLAALHLPPSFHPTGALLAAAVPRVRERLWEVARRAYRFPPDPVRWIARGLLFEVEVEAEEREAAEGEGRGGAGAMGTEGRGEVRGSWEDEADDAGAEGDVAEGVRVRVREEAERRAEVWVKDRLSGGR
ncbi:hypothetical protein JCM10450v2_004734 [Rhodotorula kratochvilovae]